MSQRKKRRRRRRGRTATSIDTRPLRTLKQGWSRAGAHNVAGVSFQAAVTAKLLVGALTGGLRLTQVTPEGYEDIDVQLGEGARVFVQVKERAPSARFGRSALADAIRKKKALLADDASFRFALVTDATPGGGLAPTGWDRSIAEVLDRAEVDKLGALLVSDFGDPQSVLARAHLVTVERNVVERTRHELTAIVGNRPSVAALVYARLVEQITEVAVRQRSTTPETAQAITPADLETLMTRVVESVDVESLDEAVRTGLVEPVDFSVRADLTVQDFLAGVDVLPAHVAADLDLPRPREVKALTDALSEQHSALLTGPSGAGKSALMWRTVRSLSGRMRPYRVLRLQPEDVPTLARWLRLQQPSEHYPLLLCADNLGRPDSSGWDELAREFVDRPGVLLLGACREEDYRPDLVVGRTTIVDPTLDRELADGIAAALAEREVQTVVDVAEAFEASAGLLMEFLSMLLTGRRLRQVVEEQVATRLSEDRRTEREILRFVATAHSAGVTIPAEVLQLLIPGDDLTPALARLDREHLAVTDDGSRWRGLHELRSEVVRDYLHRFPPPATATTIRRLVEYLPVKDACRIIEVYARLDSDLIPAAEAVFGILCAPGACSGDCARLVASLAMADAYRHARACLEVVEDRRPRSLDPWNALLLAYGSRFGGVSLDPLVTVRSGLALLTEISATLPPRPPSLRYACLRNLSPQAVHDIALRGTANKAVAWLESLEGSAAGQAVAAETIWRHFRGVSLDVGARLAATLRSLSAAKVTEVLDGLFGSLHERVQRLADELPDCVGVDTKVEADGRVVSLRLLVPEEDATLHERSVETCRVILDLCPEADISEVIVLTPAGDRYSVVGSEDGYKRIPRAKLPRAQQTIGNANVLRAARFLLASRYWTQPLRALAEASGELLALQTEAVRWLIDPHHNPGRRRRAAQLIDSLVSKHAAQPGQPVDHSYTGGDSKASDAVREALTVVRDIAASGSPDDRRGLALAARCREAVKRLVAARLADLPRLSTVGNPLPDELDGMLTLLADLLLVRAEVRKKPFKPIRKWDSEAWLDFARRSVRQTACSGYQAEREALVAALGTSALWELRRIRQADVGSARLLTDWWVVIVAAESDDPVALTLTDRLAPELVKQLAFRTFVVFGSGGQILPLSALKLGASKLWPVEEKELLKIASGLGARVLKSVHLQTWDEFVTELVRASRAAALLRLRSEEGLVGDEEAFGARYQAACSAAEACHPDLHDEATRLLGRVKREPFSDRQTLAGEFYRSVTHSEQGEDVAALGALRVAALSTDLTMG